MSAMPQLDEEVMAGMPQDPAPSSMALAASSLSACTNCPPFSGSRRLMASGISFCGVMG